MLSHDVQHRTVGAVEERARICVAIAFLVNGLAFASWVSRTPAVRTALELSPAQLGLLLLCVAVASVAALPLSGPIVHRVGPALAVRGGSVLVTAGLLATAAGVSAGSTRLAGVGLGLIGLGMSTWDVAMNVEGADVERRLGRTLMPRFHAAFSLGTVVGALMGAGAAASGVSVGAQLIVTAGLVLTSMVLATRSFLPIEREQGAVPPPRSSVRRAWREPRTLLIGLLVMTFAFTEGSANDWLTLALVDGHETSEAVGALGFGAFVAAMTAARLVGGSLLERYGRVPVLRVTAALALGGLLLVVLGPSLAWVMAGALLWGAGASLGFPVGMSAAADDPAHAAVRVSVVSSIGYTAFLAGPPLIGFLGERVGVLRALLVVLVALAIGLVTAGATRPLR